MMKSGENETIRSRMSWKKSHLPYDEAKRLLRQLAPHVTSMTKYHKWRKDSRSYFMPAHPDRVYSNFSWSDFIGTPVKSVIQLTVERRQRVYRPMWDAIRWAQAYCRREGITLEKAWYARYDEDRTIPEDIPKYPKTVYADQDWPGFRIWCGRDAVGLAESAARSAPILTLLHPVGTPQNVLRLVSWPGLPELRDRWRKQSDYDRIHGAWRVERDRMPEVDRLVEQFGSADQLTVPNVSQLTWELSEVLEIVPLR